MTDSRVVVADEEYEAPAGAAPESSPPWLNEAMGRLGWSLAEAKQAVLKVTFADAGSPSPIPTIDGGAVAEQLPSVASASIPVDKLSFTNADLLLDVEVADVSDQWAREWANANVQTGIPGPVPLGQGFASTSAALIDTGTLLLRATWWSQSSTVPALLANGTPNPAAQFLTLDPAAAS